jgi:hypothetical protein
MESMKKQISKDTYDLLVLLRISPQEVKNSQTIKSYREVFSWLMQRRKNESINLTAFSGEADPRIWNPLEKELMEALDQGMTYVHCLGPVVCTDEKGKNVILEAFREYPKTVKLYLFRTRALYHWTCFTRRSDHDQKLFYRSYGECYHDPLPDIRREFCIYLEREDDRFSAAKTVYWHNRQLDYLWRKPVMDEVTDVKQVPTLTLSQLKAISNKIKEGKNDFNLLPAKQILDMN